MKAVIITLFFVAAAFAEEEVCFKDAVRACNQKQGKIVGPSTLTKCNAKYGAIDDVLRDLQVYANNHITRSFEYLMLSTHYANYEKNRHGFEKLFRDFSDSKWHDAIDLIKYMTKRGGQMDFNARRPEQSEASNGEYEVYELESIAKALDIEKQVATEAHNIHAQATKRRKDSHDPEVSSYLEKEFVHKHAENIRKLSGYATDLSSMLNGSDASLALFLFDEYLKKQ